MSKFEILCVTMHQTDFSKVQEMNIHSNVVFANQADSVRYEELEFEGNTAKMITTNTRGVGVNRNFALSYATADICLFADDDVVYVDDMENIVLSEFDSHPEADVFIFHLETDSIKRKQKKYSKTRKRYFWDGKPWGAFRIAFRLSSIKKKNVWFTTLFGGGCVFPSGEDSMWLQEVVNKGLKIYVSKFTIGTVSFEQSSWFDGYNEKFFYGKGAYYKATKPKTFTLWKYYSAFRYRKKGVLTNREKIYWLKQGAKGYKQMLSYEEFVNEK